MINPLLNKSWRLVLAICFLSGAALAAEPPKATPDTGAAPRVKADAPMEFVPGSWTLALLPDPQNYSDKYPGLFMAQTSWIVRNRKKYDIQYVLVLGDITNNNTPVEWQRARDAMSDLDGKVPYALAMGNHDCNPFTEGSTDRNTPMSQYFPVDHFKKWPTFGGVMKEGHIENSYHLFSAGGTDWLVLSLEWAPRDETVAWASEILDKHPRRKAILITHAYMFCDDTRYDWAAKGKTQVGNPHAYEPPGSANDGQELWRKLVKKYNFAFVFSGHMVHDGTGLLSSKNERNKTTHEMLIDYQMRPLGGEAYLRLVEMLPDGKTVHVRSYSPLYDKYLTEPDQQYVLELD